MLRKIDWESQIGRRLTLRDLHVFSTVVQHGSMAKAAQQLGVSQPAVSEVIAGLEHALGVRLLDRSARGIEPTIYGGAFLKRSVAVFDELKQSIRDIEFLSDPTVGEVRIGCLESLSVTILAEVILRFSQQYPRVAVHVDTLTPPAIELPGLRERKYDCILHRLVGPLPDEHADDVNVETLFDDKSVVAAGAHTRWARRRRIDLAELVDEPWILPPYSSFVYVGVEEAFRARGLQVPKASLFTVSTNLRTRLLTRGPYLTIFGNSVMRWLKADGYALTVLAVDLPVETRPAVIVTLKNRTLSPVVERFIACTREVAKSFADHPQVRKS
jgi:DNA-binding transcriptional LysR family regulator